MSEERLAEIEKLGATMHFVAVETAVDLVAEVRRLRAENVMLAESLARSEARGGRLQRLLGQELAKTHNPDGTLRGAG